jgi:hypothetical protein
MFTCAAGRPVCGGVLRLLLHRAETQRQADRHPVPADVLAGDRSAFVRGLGVAARRLAYQRALAKRQAAKEAGDGEIPVIEEPTLDIEQVNNSPCA